MRQSRFLLSFTATALLIAPFVLEAEAPPPFAQVRIAPAPGQDSVVGGLTFHSQIVKNDGRSVTLRIATSNGDDAPASADIIASLMQRPSTSPMARMVPPPRELAAAELHVALAPGQRFTRTITVQLPAGVNADARSFYTMVRAPAPRAQAQVAAR